MRVLIIGNLAGQLSTATKIAFDQGAKVLHAMDAAAAMELLRTGRGADIVMIDVHEDIVGLVGAMKQERIVAPARGNDAPKNGQKQQQKGEPKQDKEKKEKKD